MRSAHKQKKPTISNVKSLDLNGPSGENRTHGLLNPIQARYQNCATPGYRRRFPTEAWRQEILYSGGGILSTIFCNFFGYFCKKSDFYAPALFLLLCFALRRATRGRVSSRGLQVLAGKAAGHCGHLLRVPVATTSTAGAAALRAQVDDVVGALDHDPDCAR